MKTLKLTGKQIEKLAIGLAKQMLNQSNNWNESIVNTLPKNCVEQRDNNGQLQMYVLLANVLNFSNGNDVVKRACFMVELQKN
jgi:hypothetical protein